jgi:tetratricopeptide (TPR) repeat protein
MNSGEGGGAASESDQTAARHDGPTPAALHALGLQHMQAGRHLDAQLCCQQALAIDPLHVDSLQLMGLLCLQTRQYDHAIEWIARANRQDPKAQHLVSLGIALNQQGLHGEAFKAFDVAIRITPGDAEAWLHHAEALANLQRPADAVTSYREVLKLNPHHVDAAFRSALLLRSLNRGEEALHHLDLCDRLVPNNSAVLEQRGLVLHDLKRFEEALDANLRAYPHKPASPEICNNIGAALLKLRRYEEALPWFDRALALLPGSFAVLMSKATILARLLRLDEAIAVCAQAKAIAPGNADPDFLLSELQLLTGDFEAGWAGREARWRTRTTLGYPKLTQPMWLGDGPIEGKTILVFADEGLGDTIQFARYIPMLAARGARVMLWVDAPLGSLLSGLSGVSRLLTSSEPLPEFDLHCPLGSLPLAFGTRLETIPSDVYLPRPDEARVQAWESRLQRRLGPRGKLRIGLTWSGNPNHWDDGNRSLQLQKLLPLLDLDAAFVSLQKDPRPDDRAQLEKTDIVDLTADITDLADTAALMSCLDLVISVDTSVAHLASALGRPTWILLSHKPDCRWLLGRDDSPWYGSVRLFRQDERRDYARVMVRVRDALRARLSAA